MSASSSRKRADPAVSAFRSRNSSRGAGSRSYHDGNNTGRQLLLDEEVRVGPGECEHLVFPPRGEIHSPPEHPVRGPGHAESVIVVRETRPPVYRPIGSRCEQDRHCLLRQQFVFPGQEEGARPEGERRLLNGSCAGITQLLRMGSRISIPPGPIVNQVSEPAIKNASPVPAKRLRYEVRRSHGKDVRAGQDHRVSPVDFTKGRTTRSNSSSEISGNCTSRNRPHFSVSSTLWPG